MESKMLSISIRRSGASKKPDRAEQGEIGLLCPCLLSYKGR